MPCPDRLLAVAAPFCAWLSRPRVRLAVTGVILLLIGGVLIASSVWTLPLVIVGSLMVVTAWIGHRINGRFVIQWGEAGTELEFRAKITAAQLAHPAVVRPPSSPYEVLRRHEPEPEPEPVEVIDGQAHTVEIDVDELQALIAAVDTRSDEVSPTDPSAQATRNLRVARRRAPSSDPAR